MTSPREVPGTRPHVARSFPLPQTGRYLRLRYLDADGLQQVVGPERAPAVRFETMRPIRQIPSYANQKHTPGQYWSVTADDLVAYESHLEAKWLRLLDFEPDVTALCTQPFDFEGRDQDGAWHHVPDIYARRQDDTILLVDVKNPTRLGSPRVQMQAERTAAACEQLGWEYRLVGEPHPQLWASISWLAGFRRPLGAGAELVDQILSLAARPVAICDLLSFQRAPEMARPVIFHLLWHHRLVCDLSKPLRNYTLVHAPDLVQD